MTEQSASAQMPSGLLVADLRWDRKGSMLVVAGNRTLRSVLERAAHTNPAWIVLVRFRGAHVYRYAYRVEELRQHAMDFPTRLDWPIEDALDLHETKSSASSRGGRRLELQQGMEGPAASRLVDLDAAGRIIGIGEQVDLVAAPLDERRSSPLDLPEIFDLGPMRGRSGRRLPMGYQSASEEAPQKTADQTDSVDITLSANTDNELQVGHEQEVTFRIELSSAARPRGSFLDTKAASDKSIVVSLTVEGQVIEVINDREMTVNPPTQEQPLRIGSFWIRGMRPGLSRLAIIFRQAGSDLGAIGLVIEVVAVDPKPTRSRGTAVAAARDVADDDKLALLVEQRVEGGNVTYNFTLHSEALDLPYRKFSSRPLLDRGDGPASTPLAFVERIYERVTQELRSVDDFKQLQREARALGSKLSRELFEPEVAKVIWPLRDRIKMVQIVSWEPLIPWELVRLHNPDTGETDDRFLADYDLVRTLSDEAPVRQLAMKKWRYFNATYPMGSVEPVGAELEYFKGRSENSLSARSITADAIPPSRDAFYDALADGDFDVLHISCHADASHQSIEGASLIIGDTTRPGETQPHQIEIDTVTVEAEAKLRGRRPLVFLNACETGRMGAVLTQLGGWPIVFLRAGAGAFVGTTWAVRDKPAAAFARAFYDALLAGKTLAEAAGAARASAKSLGDASWLAFKVYGHPRARRSNA
ncbi:CHAT domain-containing protein [Bradyrhizobium murdochi]|uniref:CHAT domain-containing protein n=1 Tax=Bradyrhizobium murdochi TaxID=1038859 RepID=UPI00049023BE|nr:CHAT domain-containing protein [Bradyrhizobium murdochi]